MTDADLRPGVELLRTALTLMEEPTVLYRRVDEPHRRLLLQTFFERLYVEREEISGAVSRQPFADLLTLHAQYTASTSPETKNAGTSKSGTCVRSVTKVGLPAADLLVNGWNRTTMVELRGIEPLTSCMPCKRSAN